jgi:hypothetical protein
MRRNCGLRNARKAFFNSLLGAIEKKFAHREMPVRKNLCGTLERKMPLRKAALRMNLFESGLFNHFHAANIVGCHPTISVRRTGH